MFSVYHDQKDGSEFSDVTLASEDDNDNSDLNECDQEVEKTPIEDYGQDVIFNRSLVNFLITFNLIRVIIIIIGSRSTRFFFIRILFIRIVRLRSGNNKNNLRISKAQILL